MGDLLGTGAPVTSDLVAFVEIGIAVLLGVGALLVRRGHVRLHMYTQASMVLVNIPIVLAWMLPQYLRNVAPYLPGEITEPFYLLPTLMLIAGAAAEGLGIYIVLVAATSWLPERWRFRRYKVWMRTELGLWWGVVVFGLSTYLAWYVLPFAS